MESKPDSIIAEGITVNGRVYGSGNLKVSGTITGEVEFDGTIYVEPQGLIAGEILADHVVVAGAIEGTLQARELLEASKSARIKGSCISPRMLVTEGAMINARMQVTRQEAVATDHATIQPTLSVQTPTPQAVITEPAVTIADEATTFHTATADTAAMEALQPENPPTAEPTLDLSAYTDNASETEVVVETPPLEASVTVADEGSTDPNVTVPWGDGMLEANPHAQNAAPADAAHPTSVEPAS